jgi:hypothetical protein
MPSGSAERQGLFNFAGGSFKPKDNSEGTIQGIKRLRKASLDMHESLNNNTLDLQRGLQINSQPRIYQQHGSGFNLATQFNPELLVNPLSDDRCSITNHAFF